MSRTDSLRRQHDAALVLAGRLADCAAQLGHQPTRPEAFEATLALARLTGVLRLHFAQEDRQLYPRLMSSADHQTATVAKAFFDEMGNLGPTYDAYAEKWRSAQAILEAPRAFAQQTSDIVAALADRIERENAVLYPIADRQNERGTTSQAA